MSDPRNATQSTSDVAEDGDDKIFHFGGRIFAGVAFAFLLVGGAGGWAATAELTGAVIASGAVKVDQNLKAVQHRDGGIISEIAVKEGDFVKKDEVLLRLDDAQTRAELSIVRAQLAEASIKKARLVAERDGFDKLQIAEEFVVTSQHLQALLIGETRLLEGNLNNRKSQKEQLQLGIDQLGEEIKGLEAQRAAKIKEISLVDTEHKKMKSLVDKRLIEGSRAYTTDRDMARMLGDQGEVDAEIARAKARISEIQLQIIAIDEAARTEAQRELSVVQPKIAELSERQIAIEDRLARTDIRAPIAGTINVLSVNTIGGVITPAETLVTIVPQDAALKIEARLAPTDIDQVHIGQTAKLRFSAFNQRTTPELVGQVVYVSPATSFDEATKQQFYLAEIGVSADELDRTRRQDTASRHAGRGLHVDRA